MTAHIFATEPDEGVEWKHNDWFYEIMFKVKGHWFRVSGTKLYKRRCWDKCCICGKRGFKSSAYSDWNGTKIWHRECDNSHNPSAPTT